MFLLSALFLGFIHSFELDHLIAVTNLVFTKGEKKTKYLEGIFWGIGHSVTIFIVAFFVLVFKYTIDINYFEQLEIIVGIMLVIIGIYKLYNLRANKQVELTNKKHVASTMGIIHGLAGSGSVVVLAMLTSKTIPSSVFYLLLFALGSIIGMFLVSMVLTKIIVNPNSQKYNILKPISFLAALLCLGLGIKIIYQSLV